jgi:hypothetical protein
LIYPAIANIPQLTWEMDGEEAEFIADVPPGGIARGANRKRINIKLLHTKYPLSRGCETSDRRNDLLADQFDGRYLVIVRYADYQVLDAGVIDGSAVVYSLAHAV